MFDISDSSRLQALAATELLDTPAEPVFDRFTRIASKLLDAPVALISLVEPERQFFKSQVGLPAPYDTIRQTPLSHSFCQHVVTSDDAFIVPDAHQNNLVRDNLAVRDLSVRSYLGVPLHAPDGTVLGSFCVIDVKPRDWTDADVQNLTDLTALVGVELALREEIKQRREAERQQRLLSAELHHRVKNTLAVVQSVIVMSLRSARSLVDFRDSISARIASLANTHTLLLNQQWVSTSLTELLNTELLAQVEEKRITLEGPDVELPSPIAVALGMCAHELMTNATKHGALSVPSGQVQVCWSLSPDYDLRLVWTETGGPRVRTPTRRGFGTNLLERVMKQQTSGEVTLQYRPEGLRAEFLLKTPPVRQLAE